MTLYRASLDRFTTGVTAATVLLLLAMAVGCAGLALARPGGPRAILVLVAVGCAGLLGGAWAYRPASYRMSDGALLVQRLAGDVVVPLGRITAIQQDPSPFAGAIRVAGNGGLFGFWGRFRSNRLGAFTAYATRRDRGVILDLPDGRMVLTPDEPDRLAADLRARIGS